MSGIARESPGPLLAVGASSNVSNAEALERQRATLSGHSGIAEADVRENWSRLVRRAAYPHVAMLGRVPPVVSKPLTWRTASARSDTYCFGEPTRSKQDDAV